jgi:hypothetical protein
VNEQPPQKNGLQEQAGFMKDQGCSNATSTLKMTLQHLRAANHGSFILFVDIFKAFDSVNIEKYYGKSWKNMEFPNK